MGVFIKLATFEDVLYVLSLWKFLRIRFFYGQKFVEHELFCGIVIISLFYDCDVLSKYRCGFTADVSSIIFKYSCIIRCGEFPLICLVCVLV